LESWLNEQLNPGALNDSHLAPMLAPWPRPLQSALQLKDAGQTWKIPQELAAHESIRRCWSKRQLHELVRDFWHDHFNVWVNHTPAQWHMPDFDRKVIATHTFGRFSDMLPAVASHPAMLHFLDQASSRADGGRTPNENFARELMELHTVGSDGGYDEDDIKAVAHLFSGWSTVDNNAGGFSFKGWRHNIGPMANRTVLGWTPGGLTGEAAGRAFLNHLANHPATARRVCHKLAVRLIGEHVGRNDPIIDRAVATWHATGTRIPDVIRTLVLSSEFANSAGARVRRPASLLTQMVRALGIQWQTPSNPDNFVWRNWSTLAQLGNANHDWAAPNGYPDANGAWLSVGALVSRWNMAVWFAYGSIDGLPFDAKATMAWASSGKWGEWLDVIASRFTGAPWPPGLKESVLREFGVTAGTTFRSWDHWSAPKVITTLLQTPGFQRS
ncbi:MAG: DUF1800 domain-containing protein, partial [Microthrixaceae bacterium]